jgi:hypothetical protein
VSTRSVTDRPINADNRKQLTTEVK